MMLSNEERQRYQRHLTLAEIGERGQTLLKAARVLVIGAGGLGSPALLYLAAAGVGTIGIVEDDRVDISNLHRQILFGESSAGRSKAQEAKRRVVDVNPHVTVALHETRFAPDNALDILTGYDLVLDGSDNFSTRYLANDACVIRGIPLISGSIDRFEGQVSVFSTRGGPCYRCLFPEIPDPSLVPSCAESGVLGVLPGVIGSLMATEAIKLLCGIGEPLIGRLLRYDALAMRFAEFRIARDPDCPMCGRDGRSTLFESYEFACQTEPLEITFAQLPDDALLIDVRESIEFRTRPSRAQLIPMSIFASRIEALPRDRAIVLLCASGIRSLTAANMLIARGFSNVCSLAGGLQRNPELAISVVALDGFSATSAPETPPASAPQS
ncbi:MAG: molybdopterin-synthase adenylyltransferase MoeB [Bacteroidota bacterium]|nr:molybdopterin-synthase adenylyltransferase MoeB [Bacteroidota bacterium]MDP4231822.1 molybdopterin-synthase adenylyltransferase MoeB [Bacteroidota bacterium]MDP4242708.1 molybdopterin-synthase adenylyltransferase MoeB [Bacteroidota bacterium]MDP4287159.1 molybdopterin-synthase adenylyltransferase MoeB [Bacteroidota bacterium]